MKKFYKTIKQEKSYTIDNKIKEKETTWYLVYENMWQSIISDFFTFASIIFAFWFNHQFIGSRAFSVLLFISFFITMTAVLQGKKQKLEPKEFIKMVKKEIGKQ